ncbi:PREDICTED: protein SODIUM POTASSIUM ROOT DEFECTIVE 2-like [Nelumbo nucifera]|uniref:Protein SODIUM POTASSIUM ROOT DEFECTIVE 2-like n=1 Tax=Nelumbo nucifera TaxID=4432 RepID=A0A1U8A2F9_NELNU|nr:PREDICTED: protein SODIUM POTASSIUM ROOT DEFECTIVE 2-like [Nelumbo nucifera]
MNMKTTNKMRGLMCQSPGATAVCMPGDPRSVVVPRRPDRSLVDDSMLINSKYYRLIEPRRLSSLGDNRPAPLSLSSSIRREREFERRSSSTCSIPTSLASSDQAFQVVVMKVSLHCQGCAGKVRKHLSKMEGVTSFSIDLETKRVTVMGHISPAAILESISKVKKAELWMNC